MVRFFSLIKYFVLAGLLIIVFEIAGAFVARSWLGQSSDRREGQKVSTANSRPEKQKSTADGAQTGESVKNTGISMPNSGKSGERPDNLQDKSDDTYISADEVLSLQHVGLGDKLTCAGILAKVSRDELQKINSMVADGVTYGEMEEIKKILSSYLDEGEICKLTELLENNRSKFAGN